MELLLNHRHCILPVIGIIAAAALMRKKPEQKNEKYINGKKSRDKGE